MTRRSWRAVASRVIWLAAVSLFVGCQPDAPVDDSARRPVDAAGLVHPATDDLSAGLGALQRGDAQQAIERLLAAIAADSSQAVAFDGLGSAYGLAGDASRALAAAERAVSLAPDNPAYLSNRAQAYRRFGRDDDALRDLDLAIELDPRFVAGLFNRGSLRYVREDYEGALDDFTRAIEADPASAPPYFNRAATYDALNRVGEATQDLERFLELSDNEEAKSMASALLTEWAERDSGGR